jgi:hypothetical protein
MALLANDGAGALLPAGLASAPGVSLAVDSLAAEASVVADGDLDGDLDLIARNLGPGARSQRWDNEGTGRFVSAGAWPGVRVEWAGDVDLDGDNDLLVSRAQGTSFALELYLGPGPSYALDPRLGTWSFEPHATSLAVGDLEADGFPDFALPCRDGTAAALEARIFRNSFGSGGSLAASALLDGGSDLASGARASLGDVDGDGDLDALVGMRGGELATISEVHAGTWGSFSLVPQVLPPGLLLDLDGDGDLDSLGSRVTFNRSIP